MLFAGLEDRIVKNSDRGLENITVFHYTVRPYAGK